MSDTDSWMQMDVLMVFLLVLCRFILGFNRGFKLKEFFVWKVELGCLLTALSSMLFFQEGYVSRPPPSQFFREWPFLKTGAFLARPFSCKTYQSACVVLIQAVLIGRQSSFNCQP